MAAGGPAVQLRLLVVCTANQCRSPLGEVIARDLMAKHAVTAEVLSAGTRAIVGAPATDGAIITARKLGLDLSEHVSHPVSAGLIAGSDLTVVMERQHVLDLMAEHDAPLSSTFTLPELATLVAEHGQRRHDEPIAAWIERLGARRGAAAVLAAGEIPDPIGLPLRKYKAAAKAITAALTPIVDGLVPAGSPTDER